MPRSPLLLIAATVLASSVTGRSDAAEVASLSSPRGGLVCRIATVAGAAGETAISYEVTYRGETVIQPSGISFLRSDGRIVGESLDQIAAGKVEESRGTWKPLYGERSTIQDNYNSLSVTCRDATGHDLTFDFRCYDTGVAFRVTVGSEDGKPVKLKEERSEFRFDGDPLAWRTVKAQGEYSRVSLSQLGKGVERPLTIEAKKNVYVAIAEAGLIDYAVMKLKVDATEPDTVVSELQSAVEADGNLTTPWRVIFVGDTPGDLLESNDLILNLSEPCRIANTGWIKPGKVLREFTLTTAGGLACVDFAVKHNMQYIEFDAGWYGNEYDDESDATTISVDPKRSPGPLDLHRVIEYATQHGIGVLVYVNRRALEAQLDEILPLYKSWGLAGVKFGFVKHGSQKWTSWLHEAIAKAAEHELMVYVHDDYRPVGYSRTYPNLMNQEGVRGDEESQPTEQTLASLFTRAVAGASDFTYCYFNERVDEKWSHAHQLAKSVCFYGPFQVLYWYDSPIKNIVEVPELEFWDALPVVWDDTRVLHGKIGQYGVVARRSGDDWFIGAINNKQARTLETPLDFLTDGTEYLARIYSDDPSVETPTQVRIDQQSVDASTVFTISLPSNGGQALHLTPKK